jgi:pimeloyl-ACP methyl ester carboxylesterase
MTNKQTGFAPVHNGELFYEVQGAADTPAVVFIHACICDHGMWDAQMAAFTQQYRVLRYDQRGYGKSRTQETAFLASQDLLDVLNHVGIEKAALVGCSCGGQLALDMALAHPRRVRAVVSVCGGISGYEPQGWYDTDEAHYFLPLEEIWKAKKFDELAERETHAWVNGIGQAKDRAPAAVYQRVYKTVRGNYERQGFDGKATETPFSPPAFPRLGEVAVPALFVLGALDVISARWSADEFAKGVPGARIVVIENTAHVPNMEHPEQFNRAVLEFLKELR